MKPVIPTETQKDQTLEILSLLSGTRVRENPPLSLHDSVGNGANVLLFRESSAPGRFQQFMTLRAVPA